MTCKIFPFRLLFCFAVSLAGLGLLPINQLSAQAPLGSLETPKANFTVRGQLIDNQWGTPIDGASVILKSASIGAITDLEGKFDLRIPAKYVTDTLTLQVRSLVVGEHDIPVVRPFDADFVEIRIGLNVEETIIDDLACPCIKPNFDHLDLTDLSMDLIKKPQPRRPGESYVDRKGVVWVMKY